MKSMESAETTPAQPKRRRSKDVGRKHKSRCPESGRAHIVGYRFEPRPGPDNMATCPACDRRLFLRDGYYPRHTGKRRT